MLTANITGLIWLCRTVDPSTKYSSQVEYNYARYCAGCHGARGEGNGRIGRFKRLQPANFTTTEFWEAHTDEQMVHSISSGKNNMPAFSVYLADEEQKELLAFIKENFRPTSH
jgi:mono/diheme cytochrome c family protein